MASNTPSPSIPPPSPRPSQVAAAARKAVASVATLAVALSTVAAPGTAPSARLAPGDIELGMGAHGEPGCGPKGGRGAAFAVACGAPGGGMGSPAVRGRRVAGFPELETV